jgi:hypothetical protein
VQPDAVTAGLSRRLEDLDRIRELLARYCTLVDLRDSRRVAHLAFTEDAVDDHGIYGQAFHGREAIETMFVRSNGTTQCSAHFLGEPAITLRGDSATATTPVTGWTWVWGSPPRDGARVIDWVFTGTYVDRFVRTAQGWLIDERRVTPLGPGATGWGAPPGDYGIRHGEAGKGRIR